jgi:hypothetical protein
MGYIGTKPQIATQLADGIVTTDKIVAGAVTDAKIAAMAATKLTGTVPDSNAPSGSVIQVVQIVKSDTFSSNSSSFVDVTGLSTNITPLSASNRILVLVNIQAATDTGDAPMFRLIRGSTAIAIGDQTLSNWQRASTFGNFFSNTIASMSFNFVDTPSSTSSTNYKLQVRNHNGTSFINRQSSGSDIAAHATVISTITLLEIAA